MLRQGGEFIYLVLFVVDVTEFLPDAVW